MRLIVLAIFLYLVPSVAFSQVTLQECQDEGDAWIESRMEDWVTEFQACVAIDPRDCHPVWSASILPDTDSVNDSALATVDNNDPGPFVRSPCGDCWDDTRGTWTIAQVDIPRFTPLQLRANVFDFQPMIGIQVVGRFSLDGVVYEKAWSVINGAPSYDWREVEEIE